MLGFMVYTSHLTFHTFHWKFCNLTFKLKCGNVKACDKAFPPILFLHQATGTFKFPDLFPKPDAKLEESAQQEADAPSEETEPLRWFWRQEALQEHIY